MSAKYRIAFKTLGCKLNQYETYAIREDALSHGYEVVPFDQAADVYVINTCTVTERADQHSRQQIRKALRRNPEAYIAVCGCYSYIAPAALAKIPGVDLITGNIEKNRLFMMIPDPLIKETAPRILIEPISSTTTIPRTHFTQFGTMTRAFVKIQEGCDYRCSYCVVPAVRGRSRSKPIEDVIDEVTRFASFGYGEVVLTGVHLGCYGRDINVELVELLANLAKIEKLHRLRLSSIEPVDMTNELIDFIVNEPKICRHLHLPLQSGHPRILCSMNRPYSPSDYAAIVARIKSADAGWCIGADVIVGFPGETDAEFEATYDFIKSISLSYLHVFTFSPRPGTPATAMPGHVPPPVKDERNSRLKELSKKKRRQFAESCYGVDLEFLIENQRDSITGNLIGLSDNYLRVLFEGPDALHKSFARGKITGFLSDREIGLGVPAEPSPFKP